MSHLSKFKNKVSNWWRERKNKEKDAELDSKTFQENEIAANKSLAFGCAAAAIVILAIWICYICDLFLVSEHTMLLVNIIFPITITLFLSSVIYTRTKLIAKPGFKYFLLAQFIFGIAILSIILPKHTVLAWALCIIIANHYYSSKVATIVFITTSILMIGCMYASMLVGEWDANFMNGTGNIEIASMGIVVKVDNTTVEQRIAWLHELCMNGDNRYQKLALFYYLPREATLFLCYVISVNLSRRTGKLLKNESRQIAQNEKYVSELNIASSLQLSVLPKKFLSNEQVDIYAKMIPAKEVGGDFYDFFSIDETRRALVIADVSGKGVPAALVMMKAEAIIKSLCITLKANPGDILRRVNASLCEGNELNMFVTCWLGIVDTETMVLTFANAGHNAPLLRQGNKFSYLKGEHGIVLGAMNDVSFNESSIKVNPSDKIFLYTDGVTETHNMKNELYGEERLINLLNANVNETAMQTTQLVLDDLVKFANGKEQFDDITMLVCEFRVGTMNKQTVKIDAEQNELDKVLDFASDFLTKAGFPMKTITSVNIAIEEVFVNIANYAYKPEKGYADIDFDEYADKVIITFKDSGKPFDPLKKSDPNIEATADERDIGGLGIFMVKQLMDNVIYQYKDNQNVLIITKNK